MSEESTHAASAEESSAESSPIGFSEDEIQEMLVLASRLREQVGGDLDDNALLAVAEATGAPIDYIRLAVRSVPEKSSKRSLIKQVRDSFLAFDPDMRRFVAAVILGLGAGFFFFLQTGPRPDQSGFTAILATIMLLGAAWNSVISRSVRTAAFSGAITGAVSQITLAFFSFLSAIVFPLFNSGSGVFEFLFASAIGAFAGGICFTLTAKHRKSLGLGDPVAERQALLQQLVDIQSKLRSDERNVTFLSLDVVGSTELKITNDPLEVEFTFNEYHLFVESTVAKFGGKIHSTAGDGVTVVFEDPSAAFKAGKAVLGSLFEFNAFRNKLTSDSQLRG